MRKETQQTQFRTTKMALAAYVLATGRATLIGTEPDEGSSRVSFLLSQTPTKEEITSYYSGSGTVSALRYWEALSSLRAAAYAAMDH